MYNDAQPPTSLATTGSPPAAPPAPVPLRGFVELLHKERGFLVALAVCFLVAGIAYPYAHIAMWVGFLFAGYSAVANDSIQTIGTFIASNKERPWWQLWLFIGGIFLATVAWSWVSYGGDVSYGRLASKGFDTAPSSFQFLQIAAPLFLLVLTRLRMPVSTTFLLLTSFATSGKSIVSVATKSVSGYVIAFVVAMLVWASLGKWMKARFQGAAHPSWRVFQWASAGFLWSMWLQQDAANIAVFLPRSLSALEFAAFAGAIFCGLGLLFYQGGERIQEVVNEKSDVVDVRAATVINLIYGVILWIFKIQSNIPMSTTWVFVGLLGGRELAMSLRGAGQDGRTVRTALKLMGRDLLFVTIGFVVALLLASAINPVVRQGFFGS